MPDDPKRPILRLVPPQEKKMIDPEAVDETQFGEQMSLAWFTLGSENRLACLGLAASVHPNATDEAILTAAKLFHAFVDGDDKSP
jgi:hypothetical protein